MIVALGARSEQKDAQTMSRDILYLAIGQLAVVVATLAVSFYFYQDWKRTAAEIEADESDIFIEKKSFPGRSRYHTPSANEGLRHRSPRGSRFG